MVTVTLKCIKCEKLHEVDGEIFLQMKKAGEILNPSHRGRVLSINCCSKKAPSRGKPEKQKPLSETVTLKELASLDIDTAKLKVGDVFFTDAIGFVSNYWSVEKIYRNGKVKLLQVVTKSKQKETAPTVSEEKPKSTKQPKTEKKSAKKSKRTPTDRLLEIFQIEAQKRFPNTLDINGRKYDFIVMTDSPKSTASELAKVHRVDARIVQMGTVFGVYADLEKFEYCNAHVRGSGFVIVYKDMENPPQEVKIPIKGKGMITAKKLLRVRGTVRDIENKLFDYPDIHSYYKSKVFGIHGRYLVKTYDIFVDEGSTKSPKRRLSKDYEKWCELHKDELISDPHCSNCTNPNCDEAGVSGDDACPTGFRM